MDVHENTKLRWVINVSDIAKNFLKEEYFRKRFLRQLQIRCGASDFSGQRFIDVGGSNRKCLSV